MSVENKNTDVSESEALNFMEKFQKLLNKDLVKSYQFVTDEKSGLRRMTETNSQRLFKELILLDPKWVQDVILLFLFYKGGQKWYDENYKEFLCLTQ